MAGSNIAGANQYPHQHIHNQNVAKPFIPPYQPPGTNGKDSSPTQNENERSGKQLII